MKAWIKLLNKLICLLVLVLLTACGAFDSEPPVTAIATPVPVPVNSIPSVETHNARFAYIAEGNGRLFLCVVATDNKLVNCSITGKTTDGDTPGWLPDNVVFHSINGTKYAYVASNSSAFKCQVAEDNNLVNCDITGSNSNQASMTWLPTELKLNPESGITYAYITGVRSVYRCGIAMDGGLSDCAATGFNQQKIPMSWVTNGITFNQIAGHNYAYIAGAKRLYQCEVGDYGSLINCHQTGVDSSATKIHWHPSNISFSQQAYGFYAYVADPSHMYECNVNQSGGILNCNPSGSDDKGQSLHWLPNNIAFNSVGNKKYAYVVGVYNVFICDVNGSNGSLSNCSITGAVPAGYDLKWNPNSITLTEALNSK